MKVYALYSGCRFEGGNVDAIYSTPEKAMIAALKMLKAERKQSLRVMGEDTWGEVVNKWNDSIIKIWQDDIDEIIIYEYDVK